MNLESSAGHIYVISMQVQGGPNTARRQASRAWRGRVALTSLGGVLLNQRLDALNREPVRYITSSQSMSAINSESDLGLHSPGCEARAGSSAKGC